MMVEWSEKRAGELGAAKMILHARESAIPFYLRLGYRVEGEPFVEVGIPHRAMVRDLGVGFR
jgi:predicted GNAT family N-acyltransferase